MPVLESRRVRRPARTPAGVGADAEDPHRRAQKMRAGDAIAARRQEQDAAVPARRGRSIAAWIAALSSARPSPTPLTTRSWDRPVAWSSPTLSTLRPLTAATSRRSPLRASWPCASYFPTLSPGRENALSELARPTRSGLSAAIAGGAARGCHDQGRKGSGAATWRAVATCRIPSRRAPRTGIRDISSSARRSRPGGYRRRPSCRRARRGWRG